MNKSYKYTILTLFLAIAFIFGSMAGMNFIIRVREGHLLTERGSVLVETPVRSWIDLESNGEPASDTTHQERDTLTVEQTEEAIVYWNSREGEIIHEPVIGQISMEEAIENGEKWLSEMKLGEEMDAVSFSVSAKLGVGRQREDAAERLEAYFSFWTVTYSNQSMSAILYLNAVTGKVWGAEISLYEELPQILPDDRLRLFVELAGLQVSDDDSIGIDSDETGTQIAIKESRLCAQKHSYNMSIGFDKSYKYTAYQLLIK